MKKLLVSLFLAAAAASPSLGAEGGHTHDVAFSFEGPFGTYDQFQLQRGLQVFTEVCSACHGLRQVTFRSLSEEGGVGIPEDQVKAYAANFEVADDSDGAVPGDTRTAIASDHFPPNTAAGAPDLSLMAKARAGFHGPLGTGISQLFNGIGGPEYIVSVLTGYTGEEKEEAGNIYYENTAFPGGWIAMAPPLSDDIVEYADGHSASVHHMAEDVAAFLMWAAEPKMMARKQAGFVAVLFLGILAVLLYLTNKKLWAPIKRKQFH